MSSDCNDIRGGLSLTWDQPTNEEIMIYRQQESFNSVELVVCFQVSI